MSDYISRQAAIDAIIGQPPEPHYPTWYAEQIKALPSAEPETRLVAEVILTKDQIQDAVDKAVEKIRTEMKEPELHWIPASKERPPQYQEIWITDDLGIVELVYGKVGVWWLDENYYTEPEIIAWMPANVPEPYQPEEESE